MPESMRRPAPAFHRRRPDSADDRLAVLWGVKPKTAKCLRLTLGARLADVVAVLDELGEHDRMADAVAPVEGALARTRHQVSAAEAVLAAAQHDAHEDALQAAFLAHPCQETAKALYHAKAAEALAHYQAVDALRREYAL